jgi:TetR/AcrR family transcriptional regulator
LSAVDAAAVDTPWGRASELKKRKLHPGSGTPRLEVVRNQRERLFGAIVAAVSEQGYETTTVADVIALSGVSRSAFYSHFSNKAECLAAAAAELIQPAIAELTEAADQEGAGPEAVLERLMDLVVSQPAAARAYFVELPVAGEMAAAVDERAFNSLLGVLSRVRETPDGSPLEQDLTRALLGGVRKLVHTRLYRREEEQLPGLTPDLWRWMASVVPPPRALELPRRQRLVPPRPFDGYTPGERIARAVAAVVAQKGYLQMSTDDIAAQGAISLSTFYAHFADKRDAVLGALEMSGAQVMALAVPAARRAGSWQEGVQALYEAICAYFAAEPELAQLALAGVYGAGPRALARRDRVLESLTEMLAPAFEAEPAAPAIAGEAVAATVYALMGEQLRREGAQSLPSVVPLATYITLVGFVGPERAVAVATGDGESTR